jgi:uncharacterized delta-60 repeat protein
MKKRNIWQLLPAVLFLCIGIALMLRSAQAAGNHLDYGFGAHGKTTLGFFSPSEDDARCVIIQPDGKILLGGGTTTTELRDFAVARLNADGSPDATFDGDGRATADFSGNIDEIYALALQPDGKIIAVGTTSESIGNLFDMAIARFNADGSLDTTFDGDGKKTVDFQNSVDYAYAVAVQPDGKIVVAGSGDVDGSYNFALVRLNPNGGFDTGFDEDGKVNTDFAAGGDTARGVVVLPDGKLIAGGTFFTGSNFAFGLVRYNADGALDLNFDGDGKAVTNFTAGAQASAFERMADGRLLLAGSAVDAADALPESDSLIAPTITALARYNADGTPDNTFDGDGKLTANIDRNGLQSISAVATAPNGDIFAACWISGSADGGGFSVVRFAADGKRDKTWGAGGRVNTIFGTGSHRVADVARQADGKIVAVGTMNNGADMAVARYKTNGIAVNADFSGDGAADIAVYRRATGVWYVLNPANSAFEFFQFGLNSDIAAPGDYDGDGRTDAAVYRVQTGTWWVRRSSDPNNFAVVQFGLPGDSVVQGDYDGDGKTDFAVYRQTEGNWYLLQTTDGFAVVRFGQPTPGLPNLGSSEDKPVPADFDGDGLTDIAVFRQASGEWWIRQSAFGGAVRVATFGNAGDRPVPADYDGDGRADPAVFRLSEGAWYISQSGSSNARIVNWGTFNDFPAPADYDGDGKTDIAVARVRPTAADVNVAPDGTAADGSWWILRSSNNAPAVTNWGAEGDTPVPLGYFAK